MTETSLLHDLDAIRKVLHQLRDEGFTVAIDDFGTGYSSLTHLKHFPIDTLKIDISFIADLETDPQDAAITEAIIGLARGLGLKVVAEGVGTREQLEFLDARGCHCFQGFWVEQAAARRRVRTSSCAKRERREVRRAGSRAARCVARRADVHRSAVCEPALPAPRAATFPLAAPASACGARPGTIVAVDAVVARGRAHVVGHRDPIALGAHHEHRRPLRSRQSPSAGAATGRTARAATRR